MSRFRLRIVNNTMSKHISKIQQSRGLKSHKRRRRMSTSTNSWKSEREGCTCVDLQTCNNTDHAFFQQDLRMKKWKWVWIHHDIFVDSTDTGHILLLTGRHSKILGRCRRGRWVWSKGSQADGRGCNFHKINVTWRLQKFEITCATSAEDIPSCEMSHTTYPPARRNGTLHQCAVSNLITPCMLTPCTLASSLDFQHNVPFTQRDWRIVRSDHAMRH